MTIMGLRHGGGMLLRLVAGAVVASTTSGCALMGLDEASQQVRTCQALHDKQVEAADAFERQRDKARHTCGHGLFLSVTPETLEKWERGEDIPDASCGAEIAMVSEAFRNKLAADQALGDAAECPEILASLD